MNGMTASVLDNSQIYMLGMNDDFVSASAMAFMQVSLRNFALRSELECVCFWKLSLPLSSEVDKNFAILICVVGTVPTVP